MLRCWNVSILSFLGGGWTCGAPYMGIMNGGLHILALYWMKNTLSVKRNTTVLHGFFLAPRVRVLWPWVMYNPIFIGIRSSLKDRQLKKCCDSFETECTRFIVVAVHMSAIQEVHALQLPLSIKHAVTWVWVRDLRIKGALYGFQLASIWWAIVALLQVGGHPFFRPLVMSVGGDKINMNFVQKIP